MSTTVFKSDFFVVTQDPGTEDLSVELLHARHLTPIRFVLLPSERHRHFDVQYIEALIQAYHRNPGRFRQKRHTEES
jgi:hypothetical protein